MRNRYSYKAKSDDQGTPFVEANTHVELFWRALKIQTKSATTRTPQQLKAEKYTLKQLF